MKEKISQLTHGVCAHYYDGMPSDDSDDDRHTDLAKVRRIFSRSRELRNHLAEVRELERDGLKIPSTQLYGPVLRKAGRSKLETTEFGLRLRDQGKSREEVLAKVCLLDPAYQEQSDQLKLEGLDAATRDTLQKQQAKYEETCWNTILAADRRRASKGRQTK
jgi:hypothetical protein